MPKIHPLVDTVGRPIRLKLMPGQANDGRLAQDMFATVLAASMKPMPFTKHAPPAAPSPISR